jgi:hypothetical protein
MSYGPSYSETNRQAGIYTGRILRTSPQSENGKKELNLTLPPQLLAVADEVIE